MLEKEIKSFVFGKVFAHRLVNVQAKARVGNRGRDLVDVEAVNRATLCHWMVCIGEARKEVWKKILWFGYLKGDSILISTCRTVAGNK